VNIGLRVVGFVTAALGAGIWYQGGYLTPIEWGDLKIAIPLHFLLVLVGMITLVQPEFTLHAIVALIPRKEWADRFEARWLKKPSVSADSQAPTTADIADLVNRTVRRLNRRYYVTLIVLILLILIIPASLYIQYAAKADFRRASRRLAKLAQEAPLDFSSADSYRSMLADTDAAVREYENTSTRELHRLLSDLYVLSAVDPESFESNLATVYLTRVRRKVIPAYDVLPADALKVSYDPRLDGKAAHVALLTTLGVMCNKQGDQGAYIQPYVVARQFLREALSVLDEKTAAPMTHNALGVNYVGFLARYQDYERLFISNNDGLKHVIDALGEQQPLKPLTLARLADDEYEVASKTATDNFARARYLNNRTDLRLSLIAAVHLHDARYDSADQNDRRFLADNVDPPPATGAPQRLWKILIELRANLNTASRFARDPYVLFTRGQTAAVTGQLCEKYQYNLPPCTQINELRRTALADLESARAMQLPARWFSESRAEDLLLVWLWKDPTSRPQLVRLASED
jgi:hypothetical protein